ncbi:MAG: sensor histidine kinase [Rubellimicrobium sp.]|nr:sensor histidine kinase [Rubellimicrobium sp.]
MSAVPGIDVRDLKSVRRAADDIRRRDRSADGAAGRLILGADIMPGNGEATDSRSRRRRFLVLNRSPLARRIITFNLIALILLVTGMLYFAPARENLAYQRLAALQSEALLVADAVAARMAPDAAPGAGVTPGLLDGLHLRSEVVVTLFDAAGRPVASHAGAPALDAGRAPLGNTLLIDTLARAWNWLSSRTAPDDDGRAAPTPDQRAAALAARALGAGPVIDSVHDGDTVFAVAAPVVRAGATAGAIVLTSGAADIDAVVRSEREQILKMFVLALVVSVALSLVLASTIANPIADLAAAAEAGRERDARHMSPTRVRIPDLTARPDEIGRLSAAMRGMVAALYDRIEANEQFAADVAHEIKNPLASLRSAVETLRIAKRDDQRVKLLDIIDHDVERLNRLVTDISTASRLDSELVREEELPFDLMKMLGNLATHLGREAEAKGVDFITDLPGQPVVLQGLEGRLAQVFVNLITNAISFCDEGDAIRLWARRRDNRILVVVEDTGPGIPEDALARIFQRFYSQRPDEHFGNNSGLGLAISKQIVEAHGGVIWAENIRPTEADVTSEPLGARFVVGLPV